MDMNLPQGQHSGSSTHPINIQVPGTRTIHIPDSTLLEMKKPSSLKYYRGVVRSGNPIDRIDPCDAIVFKFKEVTSAVAKYLKLAALNHRCILEPLGHGKGVVGSQICSLLALRPFENTFKAYLVKNFPGIDQYGRFELNFIKLVSDIIHGLEVLHLFGYCCPNLNGDDIAVIKQADLVTAKLWRFSECVSGEEKENQDADWLKLGYMILVAGNHSEEAIDLHKRIISGQLKGKSILRHSSLLTVRKKFNNVLAFQFHITNRCPNVLSQSQTNKSKKLEISELCVANVQNDLDRKLDWTMPSCVTSRSSTAPPKTLRGFTKKLRDVIEHEDKFIPKEIDPKDLDHHLQGSSCNKLFWAVQRLVAELDLQY